MGPSKVAPVKALGKLTGLPMSPKIIFIASGMAIERPKVSSRGKRGSFPYKGFRSKNSVRAPIYPTITIALTIPTKKLPDSETATKTA